jgi:hypothetical protein
MTGHACVTIGSDAEPTDGDFARDGSLRRAVDREIVCRPHDALDHPRLVQALVDVRGLPVALAVLGCLIGLRRVIEGTRDAGMLWPPLGTYVAFTIFARVCEFGTSQRMAAYERGQAVGAQGS